MIYLVSETSIKDAILNNNIDGSFMRTSITLAQEQGLQSVIGSYLYRTICNMVNDDSINDNTNYKKLLDEYITPYLIYQVVSDIIIPVTYKIGNLGTLKATDTNLVQPSKEEIDYLVQYYNNKASFCSDRLYNYLCTNYDLFPEFYKQEFSNDIIGYKKAAYKTNLNI